MGALLVFVFIVMPLVELAVFVLVAQWIGILNSILVLMLVSVGGVLIVRHQGLGIYRRVRAQLADGIVPAAELVDGLLILVAGLLLIVPGFISDAVGLLLLLPPVRGFVRGRLRRRFSVRVAHRVVKVANTQGPRFRSSPTDDVIDVVEVVEVLPPDPRALPPTTPPSVPDPDR
ncbi:MAG: FxsA family protein [Acidimicrobiia bacterium]